MQIIIEMARSLSVHIFEMIVCMDALHVARFTYSSIHIMIHHYDWQLFSCREIIHQRRGQQSIKVLPYAEFSLHLTRKRRLETESLTPWCSASAPVSLRWARIVGFHPWLALAAVGTIFSRAGLSLSVGGAQCPTKISRNFGTA